MTVNRADEQMVQSPALDALASYARLAVAMLIHSHTQDLIAAAVREAHEETGLAVKVAGPCYTYLGMHKGERKLAVTMACRVVTPAMQ